MVRSLKSPTFWVAFAALVVSLSSTAVAATLISGKNIKKGTIAGDRLRKNTLTGKQIAESKLSTVPRAIVAGAAADSGELGGAPPGKYVRYGVGIQPGLTARGAYGCGSAACVVSLPAPGTRAIGAGDVHTGGTAGCTGTATAPTAPKGAVCLYRMEGAAGTGRGMNSAFGFIVNPGSNGTWAYTAPDAPQTPGAP